MKRLVDSSVWIPFLRGRSAHPAEVSMARAEGGAQLCPDVGVKLCTGIQSKWQERIAARLAELSPSLPMDAAGWKEAARLGPLGQRFDYFVYPNRDHALSEGEGTTAHVQMLVIGHLIEHLPPGPR